MISQLSFYEAEPGVLYILIDGSDSEGPIAM